MEENVDSACDEQIAEMLFGNHSNSNTIGIEFDAS